MPWGCLRVQRKVELVLFCILVPLLCALFGHVYLINRLLSYQDSRHDVVLVREQVGELRRLAIDIEDSFRGYLLTRRADFLRPLHEAETRLATEIKRTSLLLKGRFAGRSDIAAIEKQLKEFLSSKHALIEKVEQGRLFEVLQYVRTGQGVQMSDSLRAQFRILEDRLEDEIEQHNEKTKGLSETAFRGLLLAVAGTLLLGWLGAIVLARSVTAPLAILRDATRALGRDPEHQPAAIGSAEKISSGDEIGELARSYEDMARRIHGHLQELEALQTIGHEINMIGPDGLAGVLRRITDRAVDLIKADVCLVLVRSEEMQCWIIEAASGVWHDRLWKSVMLWEEFPVCVKAFESGKPATGEHLRNDQNPQLSRRNLIGNSMLSVPLLNRGVPFGVLVLLSEDNVRSDRWNYRLALGLAQVAAIAIENARLYEIVREKHQRLRTRVEQLEHLAETIAHDLKGPGQRMAELGVLLHREYGDKLDARGNRWLTLLERNGHELTDRTESILTVARVGARRTGPTAVDPSAVINEVLKSRAGELESANAQVTVQEQFPLVACHSAYLQQIMDNLIANSIKFSRSGALPEISITARRHGRMLRFTVTDNGIGIPVECRERVFDAFVRLDPARANGSGIGLTIVKRIVELCGGEIWIEDSTKPGVSITFSLPLLEHWDNESLPNEQIYEEQ